MSATLSEPLIADQYLYGYADGHRLLAGSRKLSTEAASQLLLHSDLAAGSTVGSEGYWTGIPIAGARAYALMRTWPAPEMPRPGCVWTHVLLIGFGNLGRLRDLATLARRFVRPERSLTNQDYNSPLAIEDEQEPLLRKTVTPALDILKILRAVYRSDTGGVASSEADELDQAIFDVWSQQWPKLRRAFSFRTAGSQTPVTNLRFDLRIVRRAHLSERAATFEIEPWEHVAIADIVAESSGDFRAFLWKYGGDARKGRSSFIPLATVYDETQISVLRREKLQRVLDGIATAFPEEDDANTLKLDILGAKSHGSSRMPTSDPADLFDYLATSPHGKAFPAILPAIVTRMFDGHAIDMKRLLKSADLVLANKSKNADLLISRLALTVEPRAALALTADHPELREKLIENNPEFLDSDDLLHLSEPDLIAVLKYLPAGDDCFRRVTRRLLALDSEEVAEVMVQKDAHRAALCVFQAVARRLAGHEEQVGPVWLNRLRLVLREMLPLAILDSARLTSELAACAVLLDLNVDAGLASGPAAWATALAGTRDDLEGQTKQRLLAYLLALALAKPVPGCELLLERSFEPIHQNIAISQLPYDAFDTLARYLPNLHRWDQWDTCRRLRTAVVGAYLSGKLSPKSFARLTRDGVLQRSLFQVAGETRDGRKLVEEARAYLN